MEVQRIVFVFVFGSKWVRFKENVFVCPSSLGIYNSIRTKPKNGRRSHISKINRWPELIEPRPISILCKNKDYFLKSYFSCFAQSTFALSLYVDPFFQQPFSKSVNISRTYCICRNYSGQIWAINGTQSGAKISQNVSDDLVYSDWISIYPSMVLIYLNATTKRSEPANGHRFTCLMLNHRKKSYDDDYMT